MMKPFTCRYDAVLFDMDNTLHNLYAARFAAAEAVSACKGVFGNLVFSILNPDTPTRIPDSLTEYITENNLDGLDEMLYLYEVLEKFCIKPYEILCKLTSELKEAGVLVGLISNADAGSTKIRLRELELEGVFASPKRSSTRICASRALLIQSGMYESLLISTSSALSAPQSE